MKSKREKETEMGERTETGKEIILFSYFLVGC